MPSDVDATAPGQRMVEGVPILTGHGAVTGWAALHWRRARWFDGRAADGATPLPVPLLTTAFRREQPGFTISQEQLKPSDLEVVDGLPVTTAVRSVGFEVRYAATWRDAVHVIDMAAYSDLVSVTELAAYIRDLGPWTGVIAARKALACADENAWSPREVRMRLAWTLDAGLPRPLCNVAVFDRTGRHVGTPDLFDPVAGIAGEYEGALHLAGGQRANDLSREADFRDVGIDVVTMVAADGANPQPFLHRLHAAYARSRALPDAERRWTIHPPAWWIPTHTVQARRALTAWQRDRLLRYRRAAG